MKFDLAPNPDPLPFGEGNEAFKLRLKPFTGEERMAVASAVQDRDLPGIQAAVDRLVIGWEGVVDAAGNPVPLEYREDGITKKRFNAFMGAIDYEMQSTVLAGILAFLGISEGDIEESVTVVSNEESKTDTAPTAPPDDATPTTASGG